MAKKVILDPSLLDADETITIKTLTSGGDTIKILATDDITTAANGLPDNTGKKQYQSIYMSADNDSGVDNPALWEIDYLRFKTPA